MRLRLEDTGDGLSGHLPLTGTIIRFQNAKPGVSPVEGGEWALLLLDKPLEIQWYKDGRYWLEIYKHLLLKPRWTKTKVGGLPPVSVHVLLVANVQRVTEQFDVKEFVHAAWANVVRL